MVVFRPSRRSNSGSFVSPPDTDTCKTAGDCVQSGPIICTQGIKTVPAEQPKGEVPFVGIVGLRVIENILQQPQLPAEELLE